MVEFTSQPAKTKKICDKEKEYCDISKFKNDVPIDKILRFDISYYMASVSDFDSFSNGFVSYMKSKNCFVKTISHILGDFDLIAEIFHEKGYPLKKIIDDMPDYLANIIHDDGIRRGFYFIDIKSIYRHCFVDFDVTGQPNSINGFEINSIENFYIKWIILFTNFPRKVHNLFYSIVASFGNDYGNFVDSFFFCVSSCGDDVLLMNVTAPCWDYHVMDKISARISAVIRNDLKISKITYIVSGVRYFKEYSSINEFFSKESSEVTNKSDNYSYNMGHGMQKIEIKNPKYVQVIEHGISVMQGSNGSENLSEIKDLLQKILAACPGIDAKDLINGIENEKEKKNIIEVIKKFAFKIIESAAEQGVKDLAQSLIKYIN